MDQIHKRAWRQYITEYHGLRPVITLEWRAVLEHAPAHILAAAEKFASGK